MVRGGVALYSMAGRRLKTLPGAQVELNESAGRRDLDVVDRWKRQMPLHGGRVVFASRPSPSPSPNPPYGCDVSDAFHAKQLLVCDPRSMHKPSRILLRSGSASSVFTGPPYPKQQGIYDGHWGDAWFSPSGDWVLAVFSGDCEVATTYLINVADRTRVPVGRGPSGEVPESHPIGWTLSNLAVIDAPRSACGTAFAKPGVYLIRPPSRIARYVKLPKGAYALMWGG